MNRSNNKTAGFILGAGILLPVLVGIGLTLTAEKPVPPDPTTMSEGWEKNYSVPTSYTPKAEVEVNEADVKVEPEEPRIDLEDKSPYQIYVMGLEQKRAGELETAERLLRVAAEKSSRFPRAWANHARVLMSMGDHKGALESARKAVFQDTSYADGYQVLARAYYNLGDAEKAEENYLESIELDPKNAWARNNLGLLYINQGRWDEAMAQLTQATELDPRQPLFWNNLGLVLEHKGNFSGARKMYANALETDQNYSKARANLDRIAEMPDKEPTTTTAVASAEPLE